MIRMSVHMHAIRAEEMALYLMRLSPDDLVLGRDLVALVDEAREDNGRVPFREEDLMVLIQRRRDGANGVTRQGVADALDELEAMG